MHLLIPVDRATAKATLTHEAPWAGLAVAAFQLAYQIPALSFLMILYLYAVVRLTEAPTPRRAFYWALAAGLGCFAPQLWFFVGIFHFVAVSLWLIGSIWIAFFALMGRALRRVAGLRRWTFILALPVLWTGLEYFRSELYYFRFAWLTPGIAIGSSPLGHTAAFWFLGVYGTGFFLMALATLWAVLPWRWSLWPTAIVLLALTAGELVHQPASPPSPSAPALGEVVGVQLEAAEPSELVAALDKALAAHPNAPLFVLSEYSLDTPPTPQICSWCRRHERYLIIGGKQPLTPGGSTPFADTAFVIDPTGTVVFSQGKCVPIQFFDDGVPARQQRLWDSPWGKVGICICYDLSYTRITDELIRQHADILIVPTMDAQSWGLHEHALHALIADARAAEYGIPIVRVGSSGISQIVLPDGREIARGHFPGQEESIAAPILGYRAAPGSPHRPLDRWLAPLCTSLTALIALALLTIHFIAHLRRPRRAPQHTSPSAVAA